MTDFLHGCPARNKVCHTDNYKHERRTLETQPIITIDKQQTSIGMAVEATGESLMTSEDGIVVQEEAEENNDDIESEEEEGLEGDDRDAEEQDDDETARSATQVNGMPH